MQGGTVKVEYFYCNRRGQLKCKKAAKAVKGDDGEYTLVGYSGLHSTLCVPNPACLAVKEVRDTIKARVLADPTLKPSKLYNEEVNKVQDPMGK